MMNTPDNNNNKLMVKSIHTRNAMIDHDYDLEDFQYEIPRKVARWSGAVLIAVTAITILDSLGFPSRLLLLSHPFKLLGGGLGFDLLPEETFILLHPLWHHMVDQGLFAIL